MAAPVFKEVASRMVTYTGMFNETKIAEADKKAATGEGPTTKSRQRGLKLAVLEAPYVAESRKLGASQQAEGMRLPGHLGQGKQQGSRWMGKSVRNAVELFARAGVVPELKGSGSRVVKQTPAPRCGMA